MPHDKIQLSFDAVSWVFKQGEKADEDKLRPDTLLYAKQHGKLAEVGCGEVKNVKVAQDLLTDDKMCVLEVIKRQLNVRLQYAKSEKEAVTFGIVVQGYF